MNVNLPQIAPIFVSPLGATIVPTLYELVIEDSGVKSDYIQSTINVNQGDVIKFAYSKDGSQSSGNDEVIIRNIKFSDI